MRMMKDRSLGLIVLILLLAISTAGQKNRPNANRVGARESPKLSAKEIAKRSLPSVGLLICDKDGKNAAQGSGFFVKPGILVTNYHVIAARSRGTVRLAAGTGREKKSLRIATILAVDKEADLALLSVPSAESLKIPSLPLAPIDYNLDVGEDIFAVGNPEGLVGTISPGIVSAGMRSSLRKARIQISAPISHGSSGGPILNSRGEVVGVAVGSLSEGQNLNFAVPVSLVRALLDSPDAKLEPVDYADAFLNTDTSPPRDWTWSLEELAPVDEADAPNVSIIGPIRKGESKNQASLRKLPGVFIVEDLDDVAKEFLLPTQLKTDIELRLRRNRVRVLTLEEWVPSDGAPMLILSVTALRQSNGVYAYSYSLVLAQDILLGRDRSFGMHVATWETGSVGYAGSRVVAGSVRDAISDGVDKFCNAYLAANSP